MERKSQNGACEGRVMTEEQLQILRKQIAVYAAICEQLVSLHTSLSSEGTRLIGGGGGAYFDPLVSSSSSSHRMSARHRWTPTGAQLEILESIYEEGNGTPNRQRIREIAAELAEHGQITETNVYNWFQNRRARSKRKQQQPTTVVQAEAAEEEKTPGESGGLESYEHILFPSPDFGIEHLLGKTQVPREPSSFSQRQG